MMMLRPLAILIALSAVLLGQGKGELRRARPRQQRQPKGSSPSRRRRPNNGRQSTLLLAIDQVNDDDASEKNELLWWHDYWGNEKKNQLRRLERDTLPPTKYRPTPAPSTLPSLQPSGHPSFQPSSRPSPSGQPSPEPSSVPSLKPTLTHSSVPTVQPSPVPWSSNHPSAVPTRILPSSIPTNEPTVRVPSVIPSLQPSWKPPPSEQQPSELVSPTRTIQPTILSSSTVPTRDDDSSSRVPSSSRSPVGSTPPPATNDSLSARPSASLLETHEPTLDDSLANNNQTSNTLVPPTTMPNRDNDMKNISLLDFEATVDFHSSSSSVVSTRVWWTHYLQDYLWQGLQQPLGNTLEWIALTATTPNHASSLRFLRSARQLKDNATAVLLLDFSGTAGFDPNATVNETELYFHQRQVLKAFTENEPSLVSIRFAVPNDPRDMDRATGSTSPVSGTANDSGTHVAAIAGGLAACGLVMGSALLFLFSRRGGDKPGAEESNAAGDGPGPLAIDSIFTGQPEPTVSEQETLKAEEKVRTYEPPAAAFSPVTAPIAPGNDDDSSVLFLGDIDERYSPPVSPRKEKPSYTPPRQPCPQNESTTAPAPPRSSSMESLNSSKGSPRQHDDDESARAPPLPGSSFSTDGSKSSPRQHDSEDDSTRPPLPRRSLSGREELENDHVDQKIPANDDVEWSPRR